MCTQLAWVHCLSFNLKNTPKAFANFSPGFERQRESWDIILNRDLTL